MPNIITSEGKEVGTILAPDGSIANLPTTGLTVAEAELLRRYKKFLHKHGLREALYCNHCWDGNRADGTEAHVTENQIGIKCRCRMLFFQGMTFGA